MPGVFTGELGHNQKVYNTIRPHQALAYLTPQQFLEQYWQNKRKEKVSPII